MEDLCFMLDAMGYATGVDLEKLVAVRELLHQALPDIALQGAIARAGLPQGYSVAA
jgi:hydroxymethylglutaryl-CoA lyase